MDSVTHVLFEDPTPLYVALAVIQVGLVAFWLRRRTRRAAIMLAIPPVVAGALALVSWLVVTDREQIMAATHEIAQAISDRRPQDIAPHLDQTFTFNYEGQLLDRRTVLLIAREVLARHDVGRVTILRPEVEVSGDTARQEIRTVIGTEENERRAYLDWTIEWVRREDRWRMSRVEGPRWTHPLQQ